MFKKCQKNLKRKIDINDFYNNGEYYRPPDWLLQARSRMFLKQILLQVPIHPNHRVLEVGCDQGQLTKLLQNYADIVMGVDVNPTYIKQLNRDNFLLMDAQNLEFPDQSFDIVISSHTIEHIPDISKALKEFERVLNVGGYLVLIYPWEPIRGYSVLPEALLYYRTIKVCRQIHRHSFTPGKITRLIDASTLIPLNWKTFFIPHPNFISVYRKSGGKRKRKADLTL